MSIADWRRAAGEHGPEAGSLCDHLLARYPRPFVEAICTGGHCHRQYGGESFPTIDGTGFGRMEVIAAYYSVILAFDTTEYEKLGREIAAAAATATETTAARRRIDQAQRGQPWRKRHR